VDPSLITASASKQRLFEQTAEVVALGAFGVPVMAVGDRMWWGQDRLHFVEAALSKRPEPKPKNGEPTGNVIEFFHDFSSPFSYLASTQIERFATEHGATVQWCPILLGALFRSIGTPNVPLLAMSQARQQYLARDLQDWAAWWGVEFSFPTVFPVRTVLPLRISIAEPRAIQPLYHALWANNQDIGQPEIVAAVLDNAGLDAGSLIQQAATPAIKDHLRKNTARAEDVGACGVPSFYTNNTLVWGQDRMEMLSAILSGWHPTGN